MTNGRTNGRKEFLYQYRASALLIKMNFVLMRSLGIKTKDLITLNWLCHAHSLQNEFFRDVYIDTVTAATLQTESHRRVGFIHRQTVGRRVGDLFDGFNGSLDCTASARVASLSLMMNCANGRSLVDIWAHKLKPFCAPYSVAEHSSRHTVQL